MAGHGAPFRSRRRSRSRRSPDSARIRLVRLFAVAAIAFSPQAASAAPSPSPSLNTILAAPPASDYVQDTESSGSPLGDFSVAEYVSFLQPENPTDTEATLNQDGFLSGFGRSWTQQSTNRGLVEIVIAFQGGSGARKWLASAEKADHGGQYYERAISVIGISPYYGVHYANPEEPAYADVVSFIKGNDYFIVGFVSDADDLRDSAAAQSRRQFDFAPADSIRPSKWPENAHSLSAGIDSAILPATLAIAILLIVLGAGIALFIRRQNRQPAAVAASLVLMSADGYYWWDGQAWREASRSVPGGAQRSSDGKLWWDGRVWRPVPQSAEEPQPPGS